MLCFVDYIIVLTNAGIDLQAALNVMNTTFKYYSLNINSAKTKILVCYKINMLPTIIIALENKDIFIIIIFIYYLLVK